MKRGSRVRRIMLLLGAAVCWIAPAREAAAGEVILQYFEGRWETIERRMPDVFMAGYDALWLPPPGKGDSGGYSVGYDVYDRFNLGGPFDRTLYGTERQLRQLIEQAHRAGLEVYIDTVLNHNGFRDGSTPGFESAGGYPGFVTTLGGDADGDFHGAYEGGDWNMRLAGLIDIAQEKNHVFIRHPVNAGAPQNIPNETPREANRRFYPDTDLNSPAALGDTSGDRHSPSGFNLDRPLAGDPVAENATGLLLRYVAWMNEVIGVDGFRLDAEKHMPQWFFNDFYDAALFGKGTGGTTPFSYGEAFTGDFGVLASYVRKDGFGNRDVLDFPLYFAMQQVFNGGGFGDMRALEFASFDASDGDANDGSRGVIFAQSHDSAAPANDTLAYAHILTRTGFPIVYFNAREFGDGRDFPKGGRGDALGGQFGETLTRLVGVNNDYGRGAHRTRHIDGDVYIYERANACLVGLNDNGAWPADRDVHNLDFRNVTLVELTGNPGADATLQVNGSGSAFNVTVPAGGYAVWGLQAPRGHQTQTPFELAPVASVLAPDNASVPNGMRRLTPLEVVTVDSATLTLRIQPEGLDDSALLRVDDGSRDVLNPPTGPLGGGDFAGYQSFNSASPSFGGGTGIYTATLDVTQLGEGVHYLEAVAFLQRNAGRPAIFETFRKVIYVDRIGPALTLRFPTQTGGGDVSSSEYEVVLDCTDATANAVHVLADFAGDDAAAVAAVNAGNRANQLDRAEFRYHWGNVAAGLHELTVVAFEQTGNASVTRFGNIFAASPTPNTFFANLPESVTTLERDNIEIWVNVNDPLGGPDFVFDPGGAADHHFSVQLTVDGVIYPARPYDAGLLNSENTLFQNDTVLGDDFEVFRFHWRGYGPGFHTFEARAELNNHSLPAAVVTRSVEVASDVAGPEFDIADPAPPASAGDPPTALLAAPTTVSVTIKNLAPQARSVSAYILTGESEQLFATTTVDGSQSRVTLVSQPGAIRFFNGAATIRVLVSTGAPGAGIAHEESTAVLIIGAEDFVPPPAQIDVDGQDHDWTGTPASQVHATTTSGFEWIYTGDANDARTDLGDNANTDLTELRLRAGADNLFFLARLRDVSNVRQPSLALAIDINDLIDATDLNFIGDESQTLLDRSAHTWDFSIQVHFVNESFSSVEVFDDVGAVTWFSPPGERSYISADSDSIEFSIPRAALGLDGETARTISLQGAVFENQLLDLGGPEDVGWNNLVDSTRDVFSADALDVLGGEVGASDNAWGRGALADGVLANPDPAVKLIYDIDIPAPRDAEAGLPVGVTGVAPIDGSRFATAAPVPVTINTYAWNAAAILAVNGEIVQASGAPEGDVTRVWQAVAPALRPGANTVHAVAFENANLTGRTAFETITYWGDIPATAADAANFWMLY